MRGIILAGGTGARLYPTSVGVSKQLLPVYDKPTIYYPLSVLMLSGIREILIISTARDLPAFKSLFQDGSHLGLNIQYAEQKRPGGIAEAFIIAEQFINKEPCCLILGDNILYGNQLSSILKKVQKHSQGATVFAYHVQSPEQFGVIEFNKEEIVLSLEEKPQKPKSRWAVIGLYFYDGTVCERAKSLKPSMRGELEITDLNKLYLAENKLKVVPLGRGMAWLDTGTHDSLITSSQFVQTIEQRQGLKIACIEEVAYSMGFINFNQFSALSDRMPDSSYGIYVKDVVQGIKNGQKI